MKVDVYFNGNTNLYNKISETLTKANNEILIAVSWLDFKLFYDLFTKLLSKGITIKIIVDGSKDKFKTEIQQLRSAGAKIKIIKFPKSKRGHGKIYNFMHNKFCIIDGIIVINGSYNWSHSALRSFENITIIQDRYTAKEFMGEWEFLNSIDDNLLQLQYNNFNNDKVLVIFDKDEDDLRILNFNSFFNLLNEEDELNASILNNNTIKVSQSDFFKSNFYYYFEEGNIDLIYYAKDNLLETVNAVVLYNYIIEDQDGGGSYGFLLLYSNPFLPKFKFSKSYCCNLQGLL